MRLFDEIAAQWSYLARLRSSLGLTAALRARLAMLFGGPQDGARVMMRPACLSHPVEVRIGSSDPETYHQVLVEQQYAVVGEIDPEIIVDCGANAGFASAWMLSRYPRARVVAIEPFTANVEACRRNLAAYGDRATILQKAVWSHATGIMLMDATVGNAWGIRARPAAADEVPDVQAIGVADLALLRIDLLKIDIEGSEAAEFGEGGEAWMGSVGAIAVELHGPDCAAALLLALDGYSYDRIEAGEVTVIRNLRRTSATAS